ncbi:MAG TPA: c-type cytochrome [Vicinamibacteria bacterium]|nr:c-type cytochrome [Vicinamibacteria bacterium]
MRDPQAAPPRFHVAFAALGVGFLAIFSWVFFKEQGAEWRAAQARFRKLEATVKNPHQLAQSEGAAGVRQIWLPDLGRVDRCTTCHLGVDDPAFADAPAPFRSHPGTWLTSHPVERFGCTVCHDGQGAATDYARAGHKPGPGVERAMRPLPTIEASCGACHRSREPKDAPRLAEGRRLVEESGCVACHDVPGFAGVTFRGPALDSLGRKVRADWLEGWLKDPKSHLASSKMGNFRLSAPEIASLRALLLSRKDQSPLAAAGVDWKKADVSSGKALFGQLRCVSCHAVNGRGGTMGPELTRIGDKVRRDWLFSFLKDPHREQPNTAMLQYRLTDAELRDLTAFLLDEYRTAGGEVEAAQAPYQDAHAVAEGRTVFVKRGCYGCHDLAGIRETGKIGPSLAGVADRDPEQLPYGARAVRRTADNYIFLKLQEPEALGSPSLMPTFSFSPVQAATITVALASLRKADLPSSRVVEEAPPAPYRPRGPFGELVVRYRCLSCHRIGGSGGDLSTVPLDRIGSQLQRDYLVDYLLNPGAVRVSVEARMPVFHMLREEAKTIADYAAEVFLDDELDRYDARFTAGEVRQGEQLYHQLGCIGCHQIDLKGGYVGPDLSNTGKRLRPGWTAAWLTAPGRYKPGTQQPDYGLSAGDARALTAYLSSLGSTRGAGKGDARP